MNYIKIGLAGLLLITSVNVFSKDEQQYKPCIVQANILGLSQDGKCLGSGEKCITTDGEEGTVDVQYVASLAALVNCKKNQNKMIEE